MILWSNNFFFLSSRRRHTRFKCDWSSDVCSSDLQAWHLIVKEVERGTALQGDPRFQKRVTVQSIEKRHQAEDLFERFRAETGRGGFTGQRLRGQIHVTSAQVRLSTRSGTTRFHRVSSLPGSRLPRSGYIGWEG